MKEIQVADWMEKLIGEHTILKDLHECTPSTCDSFGTVARQVELCHLLTMRTC